MLFKLSSVITTALAAASFVTASAVNVQRRDTPASCTFVVSPSGTPDPSAELFSEWNYILGRKLANFVPSGTLINNGNSSVTGPDAVTGFYTVAQTIAAGALTTAEAVDVVTAWAGTTFDGPWSGVTWTFKTVTC
ncbi:hypothetical protein MD484_g4871, partial [Candolleomyces efflorescens]